VFVPFVHLVPFARDHGIAAAQATLLLGVIGIGSAAGFASDVSHSYELPIIVSAATNIVAAAIVALSSRSAVRSAGPQFQR